AGSGAYRTISLRFTITPLLGGDTKPLLLRTTRESVGVARAVHRRDHARRPPGSLDRATWARVPDRPFGLLRPARDRVGIARWNRPVGLCAGMASGVGCLQRHSAFEGAPRGGPVNVSAPPAFDTRLAVRRGRPISWRCRTAFRRRPGSWIGAGGF